MTKDEAMRAIAALHTKWSLRYGDTVAYDQADSAPHPGSQSDYAAHQADRSATPDIDDPLNEQIRDILNQVDDMPDQPMLASMTTGPLSQCGTCVRLRSPFERQGDAFGVGGPWCEAFPEGIPDSIFRNAVDHRQPVDGDHGLQWVARLGMTWPQPPDLSVALTAAANPPRGTGAMVALVPAVDWAENAAVEEGLPGDELHVTLAFLGEADQINPETRTQIITACRQLAARLAPLQARGFAVSLFNPTGDEPCIVLGLGGNELADLHAEVEAQLTAAGIDLSGQHRPWVPHITLTYTDDHYAAADVVDRCGPVNLDRLRVAFGEQVEDFALGEAAVVDDGPMQPMNPPTDAQPCPPGQHQMPDGTCMDDEAMPEMPTMAGGSSWWAPAVVEGVWSGDGRQWADGGLEWDTTPFAAKWQPAELPGHEGAVIAGRVDGVARRGNQVITWGVFDDQGEAGAEALRLAQGGFLTGVSIKADDFEALDVELVWPAELTGLSDGTDMGVADAFHLPGKHNQKDHGRSKGPKYDRSTPPGQGGRRRYATDLGEYDDMPMPDDGPLEPELELPEHPPATPREIYHKGRIRSVTFVPEPAFPECRLHLGPPPPEVMTAAAVGSHSTPISDATTWDAGANEKRLTSPMAVSVARKAYAWVNESAVTDGQVTKEGGRFLHHEVDESGQPGSANMTACSAGIGVLNGGRGGTTIPASDEQGVYDHLAAHLRDGDREPPPLTASAAVSTVVAAGHIITIPEVWPEWFFDQPDEATPFGALHITDQGRVYGRLAPAGVAHRAFRASGQNVTAPRNIDYSEFMNKPALVADADGNVATINAGAITFGCGHMSPNDPRRANPAAALEHYDNSCSVAARIRVGEDEHGTWVAGGLLHSVDADTVERMMACALSGDWQDGRLNAALLVPVEGFPERVDGHVRIQAGTVVASMTPLRWDGARPAAETTDLRPVLERIARGIGRDTESRMAALKARLDATKGP